MDKQNEIKKFDWKLLKEDKLYDRKSLVWENGELYEVEDDLDVRNILEGRLGEFPSERIITEMGIRIVFPVVKKNRELLDNSTITDSAAGYEMLSENRLLKIEEVADKRRINELEKMVFLQKKVCEDEKNDLLVYEGLIDTNKFGFMLGMITFLMDKNHIVYEFTYAGKGNYTDIKMERNTILHNLLRSMKK